jgi:hypothetical protein
VVSTRMGVSIYPETRSGLVKASKPRKVARCQREEATPTKCMSRRCGSYEKPRVSLDAVTKARLLPQQKRRRILDFNIELPDGARATVCMPVMTTPKSRYRRAPTASWLPSPMCPTKSIAYEGGPNTPQVPWPEALPG